MRITDPEKNGDCLEQSVAQGVDGRHRKERAAKAGEPGRRGQRAVGHADPADDTSASRRAATSVGVTQSKSPLTWISTPASDESKAESSRRLSESMPASYKLSSQLNPGSSTTSWQRRRITSLRFTSVSRGRHSKTGQTILYGRESGATPPSRTRGPLPYHGSQRRAQCTPGPRRAEMRERAADRGGPAVAVDAVAHHERLVRDHAERIAGRGKEPRLGFHGAVLVRQHERVDEGQHAVAVEDGTQIPADIADHSDRDLPGTPRTQA